MNILHRFQQKNYLLYVPYIFSIDKIHAYDNLWMIDAGFDNTTPSLCWWPYSPIRRDIYDGWMHLNLTPRRLFGRGQLRAVLKVFITQVRAGKMLFANGTTRAQWRGGTMVGRKSYNSLSLVGRDLPIQQWGSLIMVTMTTMMRTYARVK